MQFSKLLLAAISFTLVAAIPAPNPVADPVPNKVEVAKREAATKPTECPNKKCI